MLPYLMFLDLEHNDLANDLINASCYYYYNIASFTFYNMR